MLVVLLFAAWPIRAAAHEIPASVVVRAFVRVEGQRVRVLVRVPLDAMRDVAFPLRGAQYLDLARADSTFRDAAKLWVADGIALYSDGERLAAPTIVSARAALPSNRAFSRYDMALAQFDEAPLATTVDLPWKQAMLDVMLEYRTARDGAVISIQPTLAHLGVRTTTVLHYVAAIGSDSASTERVYTYDGDPGRVALDPGLWQAAMQFVALGFEHILTGFDHLLFLCCLVIPFRRARPVIALVTAFTVAHSITLFASALGYAPDALWFPPLIEVLIAVSIVYMACENVVGAKIERRWPIGFAFGLVHGFGFSFALRDTLQFAGSHLAVSLAAFNVGVELGQLAVLAVLLPVLYWLFTRVITERMGTILLSAIVGHTAWHWMLDRAEALRGYRVSVPEFTPTFIANAMVLLAVVLTLGGIAWVVYPRVTRWLAPRAPKVGVSSLMLGIVASFAAIAALPQRAMAQKTTRSTRTGVFTAEQAQAGREVFVGACTGCHTSASHTGAAFLTKWAGRPLSELYGFVSTRMPKANPGSLSEDEYVVVVAYVLKINGMPAGKTELSADPDALNAIRFDGAVPEGGRPTKGAPRSSSPAAASARSVVKKGVSAAVHSVGLVFSGSISRHATEQR